VKEFTATAVNLEGDHGGASQKNTLALMRASDTLAKTCNHLAEKETSWKLQYTGPKCTLNALPIHYIFIW